MSKELTEQYYNGTLQSGHYYFSNGCEVYPVEHRQIEPCLCANGIAVLCEVPSYEEYQALLCQSSAIYQSAANETDTAEKYLEKYGVEK